MSGIARPVETHRLDRSPEEAEAKAAAAVAALDRGAPFDAVADEFGGTDPVRRIGRGEKMVFRMKPSPDRLTPQPAFTIEPGRATYARTPPFGFTVWYRVR